MAEEYLKKVTLFVYMSNEDPRVGRKTTTHIEISPPKYQGTIREFARKELGADDLSYEKGNKAERMILKAELEVIDIEERELQKKSETK